MPLPVDRLAPVVLLPEGSAVKNSYRNSAQLLSEIDKVLAQTPAEWRRSPLDEVADILFHARQYRWVGIYLLADEAAQRQAVCGPMPDSVHSRGVSAGQEIVIPIRRGIRVLGVIELSGGESLRAEDRHMLKEVAHRLGNFLTGKGKWLVRQIRESAALADKGAREAVAGAKSK